MLATLRSSAARVVQRGARSLAYVPPPRGPTPAEAAAGRTGFPQPPVRFKTGPQSGPSQQGPVRRFANSGGQGTSAFVTYRTYILGGIAAFGGLYVVTHIETAPMTGRRRFIAMSKAMELRLGMSTYNSTMTQFHSKMLPQNHELVHKVRKIGLRLAEAAGIANDFK